MDTPSAIDEAKSWREQARMVRERLVTQRAQLSDKIAAIDIELAAIDAVHSVGRGTVPDRILAILRHSKTPLTAHEIGEQLPAEITNTVINATLHRMKKTNRVVATGEAGESRFSLPK
jgi:hypothetical protein